MKIVTYLTDTTTWKPTASRDAFGNPVAGTPETIRCWNAWKRTEFKDETGKVLVCDYAVMVEEDVEVGDVLVIGGKDRLVRVVEAIQDLAGRGIGRWCYC